MPTPSDILWFKQQFGTKIKSAIINTPLSVDMVTAIACQETGHIWRRLRKTGMTVDQILALCVGDTIDGRPDGSGRKAFPKNRGLLLEHPQGAAMFTIGRQALVDMAAHVPGFDEMVAKPDKFCHGYGLFQYDLQFFKTDPQYFLQKKYADFDATLAKCITELKRALNKLGYSNRASLTDLEMAFVAIAYNTGGCRPAKGLKQGHFDTGSKKYYGEYFADYLRIAKSVAWEDGQNSLAEPTGLAALTPATTVAQRPSKYEVDVRHDPLMLRREPDKTRDNVVAKLPDGQIVQAIDSREINGYLEVETSLNGAYLRGFAAADFLKPVSQNTTIVVAQPAPTPPSTGIVAVYMPRKDGTFTLRSQPAGAHSLNEAGQPSRAGDTPEALRTSLHNIIKWLAVDTPAHKRYQASDGKTFCNIYAHDFCNLAGVYLPRVWWTQAALVRLARGEQVAPNYGNSIEEVRANALFRWLRDFGLSFGWRRTGSLSTLQTEVNLGAVGLIIARRKADGKSGHVVMVVPETNEVSAKWAGGQVIQPLQSQAGTVNFQYGTGRPNWWAGEQFAESAFWLHG